MCHASDMLHVDLREPDPTVRIVAGLAMHGIAIFHGGTGRDDLLRTARSLVMIRPHRDSDYDGVTTITRRPALADGTSLAGFTNRELWPHTDGSAVHQPPRLLVLACVRPAQTGGGSLVVNGRALYDEIARTDPAMLAALATPRSAYFGGGSGHLGAVFRPSAEGRIAVRLRLDGLARFAPALAPYLDRLRTLVRDHIVAVDLREGDGYILLNDRWLHGRAGYTGERLMLRVIGDPLPHLDLPNGFPPTVTASAGSNHRQRM